MGLTSARNGLLYGLYADLWASTQARMINDGLIIDPEELKIAKWWLREYIQTLESGIQLAKNHRSVERKFQTVDKSLRLRYDMERDMYAVDRYAPDLGCMMTIFFWSHQLGEGGAITDILNATDMQAASSPQEYHNNKRRIQQRVLDQQDKKRDEIALEAVDSLSRAQIQNFVAVERAMQIGEKIHLRGEDAKFVQRQYERTKAGLIPSLPDERFCINPQMAPWRHRRMSKDQRAMMGK